MAKGTHETKPHLCPVCMGVGTLPDGFYGAMVAYGHLSWMSTGTGREACRSCSGKGYIVLSAFQRAKEA